MFVASCHASGHWKSNIPPSKRSDKTSAPFREAGSVEATPKYLSMGRKDCRDRLQDSVYISASAFQRRGLHFRETGTSAFVDTGIASSAGQRGHRTCSPANRAGRYISCDMHAHLVSKAGSLISGKSPSPVFKWSSI